MIDGAKTGFYHYDLKCFCKKCEKEMVEGRGKELKEKARHNVHNLNFMFKCGHGENVFINRLRRK